MRAPPMGTFPPNCLGASSLCGFRWLSRRHPVEAASHQKSHQVTCPGKSESCEHSTWGRSPCVVVGVTRSEGGVAPCLCVSDALCVVCETVYVCEVLC